MDSITGVLGFGTVSYAKPSYRARGSQAYLDGRAEAKKQAYQRKQALLELHERAADLAKELEGLRTSVEEVRDVRRVRKLATAASEGGLGLDLLPRATTLAGSEEVNPSPRSYSTRGPDWDGPSSTSVVTLHDDYTGAWTDTLEFRVRRDRTVGGSKTVRLDIYDSGGSSLGNVKFAGGTPPDTVKYTSFGIGVSLSAGSVKKNESFFIDVDAGTSQDLDPTRPFDGLRTEDPWLEWGTSITAGSFDVNGETITVAADDSVNDVIASIDASAAGVTASYDAGSDTFSIVRDDTGALDITVDNDTSGFLAAMKLSGATQVTGTDQGELEVVIEDVAPLSGISSGTFSINGTDVSVDVTADTLQDVIDRINASVADVTASYDTNSDGFLITGNTPADVLELDDGTSGFFTGVDVMLGTYAGRQGARGLRARARQVALDMEAIEAKLNAVFAEVEHESLATGSLKTARKVLQQGIEALFDDEDDLSTSFGVDFDFGDDDPFDFSVGDAQDLREAMRKSDSAAVKFLIGERDEGGKGGLLGAMMKALDEMGDDLGAIHGYTGLRLDIKV